MLPNGCTTLPCDVLLCSHLSSIGRLWYEQVVFLSFDTVFNEWIALNVVANNHKVFEIPKFRLRSPRHDEDQHTPLTQPRDYESLNPQLHRNLLSPHQTSKMDSNPGEIVRPPVRTYAHEDAADQRRCCGSGAIVEAYRAATTTRVLTLKDTRYFKHLP